MSVIKTPNLNAQRALHRKALDATDAANIRNTLREQGAKAANAHLAVLPLAAVKGLGKKSVDEIAGVIRAPKHGRSYLSIGTLAREFSKISSWQNKLSSGTAARLSEAWTRLFGRTIDSKAPGTNDGDLSDAVIRGGAKKGKRPFRNRDNSIVS